MVYFSLVSLVLDEVTGEEELSAFLQLPNEKIKDRPIRAKKSRRLFL